MPRPASYWNGIRPAALHTQRIGCHPALICGAHRPDKCRVRPNPPCASQGLLLSADWPSWRKHRTYCRGMKDCDCWASRGSAHTTGTSPPPSVAHVEQFGRSALVCACSLDGSFPSFARMRVWADLAKDNVVVATPGLFQNFRHIGWKISHGIKNQALRFITHGAFL